MKVLLTDGSGFTAAQCIDYLLNRGRDVVFTVRLDEKGETILKNHPNTSKSQLSYSIVKHVAQDNAFDEIVKSDPPFDAVLHTASPFTYNVKDSEKELLEPAVKGTTGILEAIARSAPSVKCVVITSSFAAMMDPDDPPKSYSEQNWSPVTWEQAIAGGGALAYRGSKLLAEKAAWDFMEKEKPKFHLSTINLALVFGSIVNYLNSLDAVNTSNQRFRDMIQGKFKDDGLPSSGLFV